MFTSRQEMFRVRAPSDRLIPACTRNIPRIYFHRELVDRTTKGLALVPRNVRAISSVGLNNPGSRSGHFLATVFILRAQTDVPKACELLLLRNEAESRTEQDSRLNKVAINLHVCAGIAARRTSGTIWLSARSCLDGVDLCLTCDL
jgi:hypothetical protein